MANDNELVSVKHSLERMHNNELEQAIQYAYTLIANRRDQRRKELWGNVVAAIIKYQDEMNEQIDIIGDGDRLVPYPGRETIGVLETI